MVNRMDIHDALVELFLTHPDNPKIIFRPHSGFKLTYPCVVYDLKAVTPTFAGDDLYNKGERYEVTFMSKWPGDARAFWILDMRYSSHIRNFVADDVVHDIFQVYIREM